MTKDDFLMKTLHEIEDQSTRHQRGTNEIICLESDLRKIEELVSRAKTILMTNKDIYSDGEVKYVYHQEFMNGVDKIYKERLKFKNDKQTNPSKSVEEIAKNYQSNSFSSEYLNWEELNKRWVEHYSKTPIHTSDQFVEWLKLQPEFGVYTGKKPYKKTINFSENKKLPICPDCGGNLEQLNETDYFCSDFGCPNDNTFKYIDGVLNQEKIEK